MSNDSSRPGTQIYQVVDLDRSTLFAVADRTAIAASFSDLIYRESEVDALWSLVDIQLHEAEYANSPDAARWRHVRDRLWEAHDLIPDGRVAESASILREIAELL